MIRRLQCLWRGHQYEFDRNVYGDQINYLNCRSLWICSHCGRWQRRQYLHKEPA